MFENTEDLISNFIEGKIADEDLNILMEDLRKNPDKRKLFDEYVDIWQAALKAGKTHDYNAEKAWQNMKCKIRNNSGRAGQSQSSQLVRRIQQVAAAVIIMVVVGTLAFSLLKNKRISGKDTALSEYIIPYGSRSQLVLPDGTRIWLNSGSKIKYDRQFGQNNRNISLEGEAYFDVKRNERLPFFVNTSELTIKVLGTAFNIKAYPDEDFIETTVEKGMVQIIEDMKSDAGREKIILKANQKLLYTRTDALKQPDVNDVKTSTGSDLIKIKKPLTAVLDDNVYTNIYTSWKDNRWIIEREELQSLATKLERRYDVKIIISDESLKHYVFSGILEDETLEQVLEAIKLTAPILYQIDQKQVILSRNRYFKPN